MRVHTNETVKFVIVKSNTDDAHRIKVYEKIDSKGVLSSCISDTAMNASLHRVTVKASNPVFLVSTSQNYPVSNATKTGDHQRRDAELWIATT
jgi:hypothetical protein